MIENPFKENLHVVQFLVAETGHVAVSTRVAAAEENSSLRNFSNIEHK